MGFSCLLQFLRRYCAVATSCWIIFIYSACYPRSLVVGRRRSNCRHSHHHNVEPGSLHHITSKVGGYICRQQSNRIVYRYMYIVCLYHRSILCGQLDCARDKVVYSQLLWIYIFFFHSVFSMFCSSYITRCLFLIVATCCMFNYPHNHRRNDT